MATCSMLSVPPAPQAASPSLDYMVTSAREAGRKQRRAWQRIMSGLHIPGQYRLLTLTSSPAAPRPIQASWHILIARLRRRGLVNDYCKVIEYTKSNHEHIHCIFRGSYIEQRQLSEHWASIHASPVVDIRQISAGHQSRSRAAYYLAKYLSKVGSRRLSPSARWLYPGSAAVWRNLCHAARTVADYHQAVPDWNTVLRIWRLHLSKQSRLTSIMKELGENELRWYYRVYAFDSVSAPPPARCGWGGVGRG